MFYIFNKQNFTNFSTIKIFLHCDIIFMTIEHILCENK